jgi:bacterioferritin B
VEAPRTDFSEPAEPVRLALEQEERVTAQIEELARLARSEGDLVGEQFLAWFLKEQLEEMSSMADLLRTVERALETNILLAEDYLARTTIGDQGRGHDAPAAAGGAL